LEKGLGRVIGFGSGIFDMLERGECGGMLVGCGAACSEVGQVEGK
jgi:hypothetical protein